MSSFADALAELKDSPRYTRLEAWFAKDAERREVRREVLAAKAAGTFLPAILEALQKSYDDFSFTANQLKDFLAKHRGEIDDHSI